jgi:hypothetical protein
MIIPLVKTTRQLAGYLLVATLLNSYVGYVLLALLPFIKVNVYCYNIWLAFDVFVCTVCHGTVGRSISGWAGQHQDKYKRYYYVAMLIDFIFEKLGDKPKHCKRVFKAELKAGKVTNLTFETTNPTTQVTL